jgi:hypothetical protein
MGQEKLHGLYWLVSGGEWRTEREWDRWDKRNSMDLYWLLNGGLWLTEREWDRWDKRNCMDLYWLLNGGLWLTESGTDGTRETAWFVLVTEWWFVVD